eukprot:1136238-Pelagomonas_calceolata.AAC.2
MQTVKTCTRDQSDGDPCPALRGGHRLINSCFVLFELHSSTRSIVGAFCCFVWDLPAPITMRILSSAGSVALHKHVTFVLLHVHMHPTFAPKHNLAPPQNTPDSLALHTHADLVKCLVQHVRGDDVCPLFCSREGGFIDEVADVSPAEACRHAADIPECQPHWSLQACSRCSLVGLGLKLCPGDADLAAADAKALGMWCIQTDASFCNPLRHQYLDLTQQPAARAIQSCVAFLPTCLITDQTKGCPGPQIRARAGVRTLCQGPWQGHTNYLWHWIASAAFSTTFGDIGKSAQAQQMWKCSFISQTNPGSARQHFRVPTKKRQMEFVFLNCQVECNLKLFQARQHISLHITAPTEEYA